MGLFNYLKEKYLKFHLKAPQRLVLASNLFDLKWESVNMPDGSECIIDVSDCTYGEPQGMIIFAILSKSIIRRHPDVKFSLRFKNNDFKGYAAHVGLFKLAGFELGQAPNTASGSSNYLPIRYFRVSEIIEAAASDPVGKYLTKYSGELAKVLCQSNDSDVFDLFEYCFREVMRNAVEHGRGTELIVFGQHWKAKGIAEIVIYDNGVGIAETLYENEYINCLDNRQALKFALLPGISGVSRQLRFTQDDIWGNSGFGLYVTSRFCAEFGSFRIISGRDALTFARGKQIEHKWGLQGTFIQMRFSVQSASEKISRINQIIDEGKNEFSQLIGNYPIEASAASKLLASHFNKVRYDVTL